MTNIMIYDIEAEIIEEIADKNDLTNAEVIEMLADYIDDMKRDYDLI